MKRLFLIVLAVLLLAGIGVVFWTVAELPPVRMVWRYGFSYGPEPTGRTLTVEGVEFVEIGPGCFLMGSEKNARGGDWLGKWCARLGLPWGDHPEPSGEMPVHLVEFQRGYWIARTEVTNRQYEAYAPKYERKGYSPKDRSPAGMVSWEDARNYCVWLSKRAGIETRLPSEAEWECACRAGSDHEFCFGDDEKRLVEFAWCFTNSGGKAHEVGSRRPNAWGLYDFHGNVWEWCEDIWHWNYENAPGDGTAWMEGIHLYRQEDPPHRIGRGGSFAGVERDRTCRSANRGFGTPGGWTGSLGFRPAFSSPED